MGEAQGVERGRVVLGSLGVVTLAMLSGIGGPPSEFCQGLPPLVDTAGHYLLHIYLGALFVGLVGLVAAALVPAAGRVISTVAVALTTAGNLLSALIGSGGEGRGALIVLVFLLPFVLLMWVRGPQRTSVGGQTP